MRRLKADFIIIVIMLLIGVVFACGLWLSKNGEKVRVIVDGKEYGEYSLTSDGEYIISGEAGGTNMLVIRNNEAYIKEASCPDGLCINMGKISKSGQSIICLPNRVVVEVVGDKDADIDAVAGGVYGKK